MTSPEFAAICCLKGAGRSNTETENEIMASNIFNGMCLSSSALSLIGVTYIFLSEKHSQTTLLIPGLKLPKPQPLNEVIRWLAVADILMALGFFTRSIVWLLGQTPYPQIPKVSVKHEVCVAVTVWIEFCCISTYMWNFTYGLDVFLVTHNKSRLKFLWPVLNWIIPGLLTGVGAFYIYYPSLSQCGGPNMKEVVNYVAYFFPMSLVIVCNPVFFYYTAKEVKSIVIRQHGRYSGAEQTLVQNAKRKFYLIMTVFIACWFPNVINAILDAFQFTNSLGKAMWAMWVLKAIMNPLQGVFNCLVFRGWPRYHCKCFNQPQTSPEDGRTTLIRINTSMKASTSSLETDPLMTH